MSRATVAQSQGRATIQIEGLEVLVKGLKLANPKMLKALKKSLKEACQPVLKKARANAHVIADDGTYAESISLATRKAGLQYHLKSTDPAAGVKEYALPGAVTIRSRTNSELSRTRLRMRSGVGVPHRANAPRAMLPAVESEADEVRAAIEAALEKTLQEVAHG
ncbi:MAG: hypothetical protein IJ111_02100 [Eggerthellaceae bacterium]|nr:hypothetical protein [Eggerthellaceae bacterium]